MTVIKGFGLIICVLMVLMTYLKQMIPQGKMLPIMRLIVSVFILFSIVDGVRSLNFDVFDQLTDYSYSENEDVWQKASDTVANGLLREFQSFIDNEEITAQIKRVEVNGDGHGFEVKRVLIDGENATVAKKMIVARYRINEASVEVMYE